MRFYIFNGGANLNFWGIMYKVAFCYSVLERERGGEREGGGGGES